MKTRVFDAGRRERRPREREPGEPRPIAESGPTPHGAPSSGVARELWAAWRQRGAEGTGRPPREAAGDLEHLRLLARACSVQTQLTEDLRVRQDELRELGHAGPWVELEGFGAGELDADYRDAQERDAAEAERDALVEDELTTEIRRRERAAEDAGRESEQKIGQTADGATVQPAPEPRGPQPVAHLATSSLARLRGPLVFELGPAAPRGRRLAPGDTPPDDADAERAGPRLEEHAGEQGEGVPESGERATAAQPQPKAATPGAPEPARSEPAQTSEQPARQEAESALAAGEPEPVAKLEAEGEAKADERAASAAAEVDRSAGQDLFSSADEPAAPGAASRPGGGGLGARPELDAWKSRADSAARDLGYPDLGPSEARTAGLSEHGQATRAGGEARRDELPKEAQAVLQQSQRAASDLDQVPAELLESDPTGAAEKVKTAAHREGLPAQSLPHLHPTPKGYVPNLYGDPISPARLEQLRKEYNLPGGPHAPTYDEIGKLQELMAKDPELEGRVAAFAGQEVSGFELPPKVEIAAVHQPDFAAVLARIITEAQGAAAKTIEDARKSAYPDEGLTHAFPELGKAWVGEEERFLRGEMQRVAQAAGISKEALDAAVLERQQQLASDTKLAEQKGDEVFEDVKAQVTTDFGKTQATIEGLRQEWEEYADARAAAVSGNVDYRAIRQRQTSLQQAVRTMANDWIVAYDDMRKQRSSKLVGAAQAQKKAYDAAIERDRAADREAAGDDAAKLEAIEKDKSYGAWVEARMKAVQTHVSELAKANDKTVERWQGEMREVRDAQIEALRDWADRQIGRERGWFDSILAWIYGWRDEQKGEAEAFAKQRAAETVAATGTNLQLLYNIKAKFGETLEEDEKKELEGLSEEQRAVVDAYYAGGGGDTIGAVAAGLKVRLHQQRKPEIAAAMRQHVLGLPTNDHASAEGLKALSLKSFGQDAAAIAIACKHGFNHRWGTDEAKIFGALSKVPSREVGKAVRAAYWQDTGEDFDRRLYSELAGGMFDDREDFDRANALLEANAIDAAAAELRRAVQGLGTDEDTIKRVLRELQKKHSNQAGPIDLEAVKAAYRRMYGESLEARLRSEMSGVDRDVSLALHDNNEEKADAIELEDAQTGFLGPNQKDIEKVYQRVHDEEWARGKQKGLSVEEIEANIRKRLDKTSDQYSLTFQGAQLKEDFKKLPKNLADLAVGLQDQDWAAVDAARFEIERRGIYGTFTDRAGRQHPTSTLYVDDDVVNKEILGAQYDRAYERRQWQLELELRKQEAEWNRTHPETPWSADERRRRMRMIEQKASQLAQADAQESMTAFKARYMQKYEAGRDVSQFDDIVLAVTQGTGEEEARERLKRGGYLPPHLHIEFATKGAGTDEERLKAQLRGKTKAEIQAIRSAWELEHPGRSFDEMVLGELSGRERFDVEMMLVHGEPTNPVEALALARDKRDYEARTGGVSAFGKRSEFVDLENQIARLETSAAEWQAAQQKYPASWQYDPQLGWVETQSAAVNPYNNAWKATFAGVQDVVELHRQAVDADADFISSIVAMVVAVALAAVLAPFTAGASLAVLAAVAAGVAAASTAAMMLTKWAIKGDAYSNDEIAMDLAFGVVDMAVSAVTAGVGGKMLRAAIAAKQAARNGGKAVSKEALELAIKEASKRTGKQAAASVAQETAQGLFTSVAVPAFMDEYGRDLNPALGMVVGMGLGMGAGIGMSKAIGAMGAVLPRRAKFPGTPDLDLVDVRYEPKKLRALHDAYLEANPGRTSRDFLSDYDDLLLKQMKDQDVRAKWQEQARRSMLEHVPEQQRAQFAETPLELMSDKEFRRLTGSRSKGEAVVLIKDGKPTVIVRQGASPTALRREAAHLLQAVDEQLKPKLKLLDEGNLANWRNKDLRERFSLYTNKLDLEIDAARRDLALLRESAGRRNAPAGVAREIADVEDVLRALHRRRGEVAKIGPLRRTLMAWGGSWFQPQYLKEKPRLFAKQAGVDTTNVGRYTHGFRKRGKLTVQVESLGGTRWDYRRSNYPLTDAEVALLASVPADQAVVLKTVGSGDKPAHVQVRLVSDPDAPPPVHFVRQSDDTFKLVVNEGKKYPPLPDGWHYVDVGSGTLEPRRFHNIAGDVIQLDTSVTPHKVRTPESTETVWDATPAEWAEARKTGKTPEVNDKPTTKSNIVERGFDEDGIRGRLDAGDKPDPFLQKLEERLDQLGMPSSDPKAQAQNPARNANDHLNARGDQDRALLRTVAKQALVIDEIFERAKLTQVDTPAGTRTLADLLELGPDYRQKLLDDLFGKVQSRLDKIDSPTPTLSHTTWDAYRQVPRDHLAELLARLHALDAPLDVRRRIDGDLLAAVQKRVTGAGLKWTQSDDLLAAALRNVPDKRAGKGNLWTAFRERFFERSAGFQDPAIPSREVSIPEKLSVQLRKADGSGVEVVEVPRVKETRDVDGYVRIAKDPPAGAHAGVPGKNTAPDKFYGVDDKAGGGAFKVDQANDYALYVMRTPEAEGFLYVFDGRRAAEAALDELAVKGNAIAQKLLESRPPGFFFGFFENGELKWVRPASAAAPPAL